MLLYDDQNGDALHQETEPALAGGAISLVQKDGSYSQTGVTKGGLSNTDVPGRVLRRRAARANTPSVWGPPTNYNPTTGLSTDLEVSPATSRTWTSERRAEPRSSATRRRVDARRW